MSSFWQGLVIQWRVVGALLIREIYSRFGRESLGFAWIVAEPLVFALPVLFMWRAIRGSQEHGLAVMPFLWSGYLPLLLFRHLGGRILLFIRANVPLLYHRRVAIFDIFLARALLEIFSNLTALVVSFAVFYAVGSVDVPRDLPMFYLGYFYMIWWAVASALIIGALCERTDWVAQVWMPFSYMYMIFSGFFYLADWLPPALRSVALCQPYTQSYEMIRAGVFGTTITTYGDPAYTTLVLAILTLFGLWLMRESRKYVVIE
ncbi:MAG TPA: ABC transporter permease [Stellaceae bacterium]|nr:ABC transporter permease [Stellaceae bacterium]